MSFSRKTYVRFWFAGTLVDESVTREVSSRDIDTLEVPDRAYGFHFFDIVEGHDDVLAFQSEPLNKSGMYFLGGTIMDETRVCRQVLYNRVLLDGMRRNNWSHVIQTRNSLWHFQPFLDGDVCLDSSRLSESVS